MKKILISGGAGFIGSHLVDAIIALGHRVCVLDNFSNGKMSNIEHHMGAPHFELLRGDIRNPETCNEALDGIDQVFHLACLGVRHSIHSPVENHQVNATGTLNLLEAAKQSKVERFVYMSTSEIYGRAQSFPIHEEVAPWPLTVYGASKLAGEHYARAYYEVNNMPVVCMRCFNNYGPRAHFEGDSGEVIPRFLLRALKGLPPQIFGDGSHTRDFLFVKDCAKYLAALIHTNVLDGAVVNLGYGKETTISQIAEDVLCAAGIECLSAEYLPERPADVPRLWVDTSKLENALKIKDLIGWKEGLKETYEYYSKRYRDDPSVVDQIVTENWKRS